MNELPPAAWPALPLSEWSDTYATLHRWIQIVGKTRLVLTPRVNQWWNVTLYVSPRGLTTSLMHAGDVGLEVEFDLIDHVLRLRTSTAPEATIPLGQMTVARFHEEYFGALRALGIHVRIHGAPNEVEDATPFASDHTHSSYDPEYVARFRQVLFASHRVFADYHARFSGKSSPVHFFWGSFDLSVSRFSGTAASIPPTAAPPNCPMYVIEEAYSHEEMTIGFWPGTPGALEEPAYFAYIYPAPEGYSAAAVRPAGAYFHPALGEFILPYEVVRTSAAPDAILMEFLQSSYEAGARLAGWDLANLERAPLHGPHE